MSAGSDAFRYPDEALHERWPRLHRGDREPFPDANRIARLVKSHVELRAWIDDHGGADAVAGRLQDAWREFHAGRFERAIRIATAIGVLGVPVACKAAAIRAATLPQESTAALEILQAAAARAEGAPEQLPVWPNLHYTLGLVLGRYSQRISVVRALAEGLGNRVRALLDRTLELEPRHAEAHTALGLYHAEIVGKLGALVANLTYRATPREALAHFRRAIELTPDSAIAHLEYAHGLMLLDARANRTEAAALCKRAAGCTPADAMEQLDVERAASGLRD